MAKRILVVDDSPSMRQIVGFTLKGAGYEVVEAVDGRDAIAKLPAGPYHLILTDLNMPNLDGIGLIREIRSNPGAHKFVPVVILTTESQEERKQEGRAAGATGWIIKPFKSDQLLTVARKVLGG